jgi:hypothetical protein
MYTNTIITIAQRVKVIQKIYLLGGKNSAEFGYRKWSNRCVQDAYFSWSKSERKEQGLALTN